MSEWTNVGNECDVPEEGTYPVNYGDQPVCLYKLDGQIYATHDICTHGAANLSEGFVIEGQIECPFHQGLFDIKTGKATAAPCTIDLKTYAVKMEEGGVIWIKEA